MDINEYLREHKLNRILFSHEIRNVVIHFSVMVGITVIFILYFKLVQNSFELQQQIEYNPTVIPIGWYLALEGYIGYVALKLLPFLKEKRKLNKSRSNIMTVIGYFFFQYGTWLIDFIGISIVAISFFAYTSNQSEKVYETLEFAERYFVIYFPLGFIGAFIFGFSKKEIKYI